MVMAICALVPVESSTIEVLPASTSPYDVLEQGPYHSVGLGSGVLAGWTLFWSSSSYQLTEVNEFATSLAKQLVKGDACLVHSSCQQQQLDDLLHSRHWRMAQPSEPRTPTASSSHFQQQDTQHKQQDCSHHFSSSSSSSQHAVLKRTRSLQHIAAANSTRQRILSSMSSAGACPADNHVQASPPCTTQQHACGFYDSSSATAAARSSRSRTTAKPGPQQGGAALAALPPIHTSSQNAAGRRATASCSSSNSAMEQLQLPFSHLHCSTTYKATPFKPNNSSGSNNNNSSSGSEWEPVQPAAAQQPSVVHGSSSSRVQQASNNHTGHLTYCCTQPSACSVAGVSLSGSPCTPGSDSCTSSTIPTCSTAGVGCQQLPPPGMAAAATHQHHGHHQQQVQQCAVSDDAGGVCPAWEELSVEVVGRVASFMGSKVGDLMPIYLTCRSWRRAVLDDDQLLLGLSFRLNSGAPFKPAAGGHAAPAGSAGNQRLRMAARQQHPALLERASKLGNVSALVVRARLLDACGSPDDAMRCWRKAAKAGHIEGQLVYGLGLYRGSAGLAADAEDAHIWLLKALKQVQKRDSAAPSTSSSSSAAPAAPLLAAAAQPASGSSRPVCGDASGLSCRVLAQAGLVLGYLAFDGEGTRTDKRDAVKYFKLAAGAGCKEAQQVLGWIYNTGQY